MVLGTGNFVLCSRCEINDGMKRIRLAWRLAECRMLAKLGSQQKVCF